VLVSIAPTLFAADSANHMRPVAARGNPGRARARGWNRVRSHGATGRRDFADCVDSGIRETHIAVTALAVTAGRELAFGSAHSDTTPAGVTLPTFVRRRLGEPHVAIRAKRRPDGRSRSSQRRVIDGDARRRHLPYGARRHFRVPQIPVRANGDARGPGSRGRILRELLRDDERPAAGRAATSASR